MAHFSENQLPPVPEPGQPVPWEELDATYDWVRAMRGVEQEPKYHAEGDVWIHTRLVCEALVALPAWQQLPPDDRRLVFWGALLHDVSKPECTRREDGRITSRGHSLLGERATRQILWRMGANVAERELVARMVQLHQWPFFAFDRDDPQRIAIRASCITRNDLLCLLAEADIRGRECEDQQHLLDNIELFRELCRELGCFRQPFAFASAHSRFEYFRREGRDPQHDAFDDTQFTCTLMCGLPGSGKDTWLSSYDQPVISLDAIRVELGISPEAEQGPVVVVARERAKEYLRRKQPFAWNSTNLTRKRRGQLTDLFANYGARVHIAYVESPPALLFERNRARADRVPDAAMDKMLRAWEAPDTTEAQVLEYVT